MKKLIVMPVFALVLVGCGSEYDEVIDESIAYYHEENANTDEEMEIRENADIKVWEDGRYISAVFYDEEGNEEGDFIIEELRGEFTDLRGDLDAARQSPNPDYQERFGEEID